MIIIGEKINGSIPSVAAAIAERNGAFIQNLVRTQIRAVQKEPYFEEPEPFFLDLCAACEPEKETDVLRWLIEQAEAALKDVTDDVRLCLDSPNPEVLLACMKDCSKPGILNSASLEITEMGCAKTDLLFPAIAGTEWRCVTLLFADRITHRTEERMALFHEIYDSAKKYGLDSSQLYIDPICEAAATAPGSFPIFEACCRLIRQFDPKLHLVSGAANISYGFPRIRRPLNAAFLSLAVHAGLDCALLNPADTALLGALYAAELLTGKDEDCMKYIGAHRQGLF